MRLHQLDVNLLVALDVLLRKRHVTRAAALLGVSQSAMSQTLSRLRGVLDDPLLVRSGGAMVPTPRALALEGPLREALLALEHAVMEAPEFDPLTAERRFRIAMFDMASVTLLPPLVQRLHERAPGVELDVIPMDVNRVASQVRAREVDVAVMTLRDLAADLCSRPLFRDVLVSMVRETHPLLSEAPIGQLSLQAFARWPHATFRITGRGPTELDEHLAELGVSRKVALRVPYFLAAPALVCGTDLIISMPRSSALAFASHWPVVCFAPPVQPMEFTVHAVWARTQDADVAQRWLREQLFDIVEAQPGLVAGPSQLAAEAGG